MDHQNTATEVLGFRDRLKSLIQARQGRAVAEKAGIGYSTFHNYMSGASSPTLENLVLLSKALNVSVEWLATGTQSEAHDTTTACRSESIEIPYIDNSKFLLLGKELISEQGLNAVNLKAFSVASDVMSPTFAIGSVLLVDQSKTKFEDGRIFLIKKERNYLIKRVQISPEGYSLNTDNVRYRDITVTEAGLAELQIIGQVAVVISAI